MSVTLGGSSGIVLPDSTTIPAAAVTTFLSPGVTDTANTLTLQPGVEIQGSVGVKVNNTTVTTANTYLPTNTVAPAITGNNRDTQVLTVSTGTWTNSPSSYSYQWKRNGTTNVGTNANTYTCVTADIGYTIKCSVTATNGIGGVAVDSNSTATITANTYTATYLVIAGGGGGGTAFDGGGGGAGGYLTTTTAFTPGVLYTCTVGAGGGGGVWGGSFAPGNSGSNSTVTGSGFTTITSIGGGGGGGFQNGGSAGKTGGSGGGAGNQGSAGSGTAGQGNNGGGSGSNPNCGGGGGGAGGAGGTPVGGSSASSSITGSSVARAGGGGGGSDGSGGSGGGGGAGAGGGSAQAGGSAPANTGSGGGGAGGSNINNGGSGGSGVIILSIPTSSYSGTQSGASVTTSGSNTIITFNSSGTYTA